MEIPPESEQASEEQSNLVQFAWAIYGLQLASFIFGITWLIGLVMCLIKRPDAEDTWLYDHYSWQLTTFLYGMLWMFLGGILMGIWVGYLIWFAGTIWVLYRIIKGGIRLSEERNPSER